MGSSSSPGKGKGGGSHTNNDNNTGNNGGSPPPTSSTSSFRALFLVSLSTLVIALISMGAGMYMMSKYQDALGGIGRTTESSNQTMEAAAAVRRQQQEILELLRLQQNNSAEIQKLREKMETDYSGNIQEGSFPTEQRADKDSDWRQGGREAERYVIDSTYAENGPQRLYYLKNMLSAEECERLLGVAEPFFKPSETMGKSPRSLRDSESAFIQEDEVSDDIVETVINTMHREAAMPNKFGEILQLTRYSQSQKYELHFDSSMELGRLVTVLVFLQDVPEGLGGETVFPHARIKPWQAQNLSKFTGITLPAEDDPAWDDSNLPPVGETHSYEQPSMQQFCDHPRVLKFRPRQGDAIMWFNHDPELLLDGKTVHGGCPPKTDKYGHTPQKTIAQRWMRYYRGENEFVGILKDCGVL